MQSLTSKNHLRLFVCETIEQFSLTDDDGQPEHNRAARRMGRMRATRVPLELFCGNAYYSNMSHKKYTS